MEEKIQKLLKERYYEEGESSWEDLVSRVSKLYPDIYEDLLNMNFIFSSPTLMNYGKDKVKGTLSSCFIIDIDDNIKSIFESITECAEITRAKGGVGFDASKLRGSNEYVSGIDSNSGGPLSFIQIFDSTLDGVRQGLRRGAGMVMLEINHPDILKFIEAKEDNNKFSRFNFSVKINNDFYDKLGKDPNSIHKVKNIVDKKEFDLLDKDGNPITVKQLWDKIINSSYLKAEPGIFNSDIAYERCTVTNLNNNVSSNPCVTGDTLILTKKGNKKIIDLVGKETEIWNGSEWSKVIPKVTGENQEIIDFTFSDGTKLSTTLYHTFIVYPSDFMNTLYFGDPSIEIEANFLEIGYHVRKIKEDKTWELVSVINIERRKEREKYVYCFNEPKNHTGVFNNILTKNCSEFSNIPYTSCCLGSINLSNLIKDNKFDWEKFEDLIVKSTRALNAVIDNNSFPLKKIKDITEATRPIGLGIMGLAHLLYSLKIPYTSKKAIKLVKDIIRYLTLRSMKESVEMSKEIYKNNKHLIKIENEEDKKLIYRIGTYPAFDYDLYIKANERFFTDDICRNVDVIQLKRDIKKYGIINSSQTSIAPTGSIAFLSNTSGGIEPVFALSYIRKIEKENKQYEEVYLTDPVFEEFLNNEFSEKDKEKILKYVTKNNGSCQGCDLISEDIQEVFVTAQDLTPKEHLDILEVVSNNVSLSVSKTINVPKSITKDEISDVFLEANKRGIIGVTCYREGSREGILIHNSEKDNKEIIIEREAPKRPKRLKCHVYRLTVKGEKWVSMVGMYNGSPYEIFAGKVDLVDIPSNIEDGYIIKATKGEYHFEYNGEVLIKNISKIFETGGQESITRLISTGLRHGVPIKFINEQLSKSKGNITDFSKAITRTFKKYLKDGDTGETCKCGGKIIYIDGCKQCQSCGVSWCS